MLQLARLWEYNSLGPKSDRCIERKGNKEDQIFCKLQRTSIFCQVATSKNDYRYN